MSDLNELGEGIEYAQQRLKQIEPQIEGLTRWLAQDLSMESEDDIQHAQDQLRALTHEREELAALLSDQERIRAAKAQQDRPPDAGEGDQG